MQAADGASDAPRVVGAMWAPPSFLSPLSFNVRNGRPMLAGHSVGATRGATRAHTPARDGDLATTQSRRSGMSREPPTERGQLQALWCRPLGRCRQFSADSQPDSKGSEMVPEAGLEPAWVSPHAPQTCVSAIPPLRHRMWRETPDSMGPAARRRVRRSRRAAPLAQVLGDLARRVRARAARDAAAGMRARAAQVEAGDGRRGSGPSRAAAASMKSWSSDGSPCERMAAGEAVGLLEVERRQDLAADDERREARARTSSRCVTTTSPSSSRALVPVPSSADRACTARRPTSRAGPRERGTDRRARGS